jgi:alpha-1,3-rhamnosyl/mannosyltransferase
MRVGFDGRSLESPAGGVRRYGSELLSALARVGPTLELVVLGASPAATLPVSAKRYPVRRCAPTNFGWALFDLPRTARRARLDLFHAPAYTAPLYGVHPLVLTVHDVSYARHPEWYPYRSDWLRRWFYRRSARAADFIVTDSEFMRREISGVYDIHPDRIEVVPLGVGEPFVSARRSPLPPPVDGVTGPYILHVGDLHPRRNLPLLVRAVSRLAQRTARPSPLLVFAGTDRGERAAVEAEAARARVRTRFVGTPDDMTLARLYVDAAMFAYPSRYEGFGLPLLEAMACDVPVVAARAAAIPEVVGDAGILIDPDDEEGFAAAMTNVMEDAALALQLRDAGRARSATFTWDRTAVLTTNVYRAAIAANDPTRSVDEKRKPST